MSLSLITAAMYPVCAESHGGYRGTFGGHVLGCRLCLPTEDTVFQRPTPVIILLVVTVVTELLTAFPNECIFKNLWNPAGR